MFMNKLIAATAVALAFLLAAGSLPVYAASTTQGLSEGVYRQLTAAQKDLKNKDYAGALSILNGLFDDVKGNSYELAIVYQNIAYVYIDQNQYKKALPYMKKSLDLNALPDVQQHQQTLTLAQLYISDEQYQNGVNLLEKYFAVEKKMQAKSREKKPLPTSAYILAASAYYQLHRLPDALKYVKMAINADKQPHESWYGLWLGIEYDMKNFATATDILKKMVTFWPDKPEYWRNLSGLYLQQNQDKDALATLRIAYSKGFLDEQSQLLNMARLAIVHGIPYFAGSVVEKGMQDGKIKKTIDNIQLMATAWIAAQETDKAVNALDEAGRLSGKGNFFLEKAQLCYQDARWDCAASSADEALSKGLKEPGKAYIMKGQALAQNKKYADAKKAFHKAEKFDSTKKQATDWIKYVDSLEQATS